MSIVTALATWQSKVGASQSLLLTVVASPGTYPLALTNGFFQAIHSCRLTVSGLRPNDFDDRRIGNQVAFLLMTIDF